MPRKTEAQSAEDQIVDAAMRLAAERRWHDIALADIASAAGLGLIQVYRTLSSKPAILRAFFKRIDATVLATSLEADASERDRLFDVLMRRFDALTPYRPALKSILGGVRSGHLDVVPMALCLPPSMAWMLEAAGLSAGGLKGLVRVKVLTVAYLCAFRVFLGDDGADLARTMAALDRALGRALPFLGLRAAVKPDAA